MDQNKPPIYLYTDGAASGNPGPGGYGIVLKCAGIQKEMSGGFAMTTNNRMELLAVIKGLEAIKWQNAEVHVYSDSSYVVNAINKGWLRNWQKNGWKKADKSPVLNKELWLEIIEQFNKHDVTVHWVKGHAENEYNNRCDQLAVAQTKKYADLA